MRKVLLIFTFISVIFANNFFMPYIAYLDYTKSVKNYGLLGGVYYSSYQNKIKFEMDAEYLYLKYKKTNDTYKQADIIPKLTYYNSNYDFKIGIHLMYINDTNNISSSNEIYFVGAEYYQYLKYNAGIDYFYSDYEDYDVHQFTPYFGFNFGDYYSQTGSFYFKTKMNYIHITKANIANKQNYFNFDFYLTNYIKNYATTLKASIGKSAYKVDNGGFVVYNLGEEYKSSFGIDIKYTYNKVNTFGFSFNYSTFDEDNNNAHSIVYLLSYTRAF